MTRDELIEQLREALAAYDEYDNSPNWNPMLESAVREALFDAVRALFKAE